MDHVMPGSRPGTIECQVMVDARRLAELEAVEAAARQVVDRFSAQTRAGLMRLFGEPAGNELVLTDQLCASIDGLIVALGSMAGTVEGH